MTILAAIYLRVSTDEQATDGYGLAAQRRQCEAMATVKGWELAGEYTDEGISGTKDASDRPGLAALLDAACGGQVQAVIVSGLDRLGRSTRLVLDLVDRLDNCGVAIVSCKESLDTETAAGRFVLRMFASLSELERDNIIERTTAGRNARGKIDGDRGGRVPYGYRRVKFNGSKSFVEVDADKAVIVRRIAAERRNGEALASIAHGLNSDGIASPRGATWHASSIKAVLDNYDAYRGGRRGQSGEHWPAILD